MEKEKSSTSTYAELFDGQESFHENLQINRENLNKIFEHWELQRQINISDLNLAIQQQRSLASFLSMTVCDALSSCIRQLLISGQKIKDFYGQRSIAEQLKQLTKQKQKIFFEWLIATSLSLCIGYSLILKDLKFDPRHIRYMFQLWYQQGLGSRCLESNERGGGPSIDNSIQSFMKNPTDYVKMENGLQNGNGTIMRVSPIVVAYHRDKQMAIKYAQLQSLTTHDGIEAKQCCRLLASIIQALINRKSQKKWRKVIDKVCSQFKTQSKQVKCLALSIKQTQQMYDQKILKYGDNFFFFNYSINDRDWNWKSPQFKYSQTRSQRDYQTIGSYCMDGLAMALHSVWHTNSFKQCVLFNINLGGDFNTVGSIAGQITGAIYGMNRQIIQFYYQLEDFKLKQYQAVLIPLQLMKKKLKFTQKCKNMPNNSKSNYYFPVQYYIEQERRIQVNLSASQFYFPSSLHKPGYQIQQRQYKKFKECIQQNKRIHKLIKDLKAQKLLSYELNIFDKQTLVAKKLILHDYWKKYMNHDDAFHGSPFQNMFSIAKYGLKKPDQKAGDYLIKLNDNHIQRYVIHDGIPDFANAIFSTPSVFYASLREYIQTPIYPVNTKTLQLQGWRGVVQLKLKRGTYSKHKATSYHPKPINGQPILNEFRSPNNGNKEVVAVAIVLISNNFFNNNGENYSYVNQTILNSKEQILMKAKKYQSQHFPN